MNIPAQWKLGQGTSRALASEIVMLSREHWGSGWDACWKSFALIV